MRNRLIIIGAGGHGKVSADCAQAMDQFTHIGFLDARTDLDKVHNWPVLGTPECFTQFIDDHTQFFVAIGNNRAREHWQREIHAANGTLATLVHPSAVISQYVTIGAGSLVLAGAVINIDAALGLGCIVNTGATIDHDCQLGQFVHVAPGSNLTGAVVLEDSVFVGAGSVIIPGITIGKGSQIGAGATVIANLDDHVVAVGTPARVLNNK